MAFKDQNPNSLGPVQQGQWAAVWIPILRGMLLGIQQSSGGSGLPDQAGHNGEFLTTDGSDASWGALSIPDIDTVLAQGGILSTSRQIDSTNQFFSIIGPRTFRVGDSAATGNGVLFTVGGLVGAAGEYIGLQAPSIRYKNTADFILDINAESLTANRDRTEPDKDGTYAMTSDIGGTIVTAIYGTTADLSAGVSSVVYDVEFTGSTGAAIVLLPLVFSQGDIIIIGDLDSIAATSNITVDAGSGNLICAATNAQTAVMNTNGQCLTLKMISADGDLTKKWKVQ